MEDWTRPTSDLTSTTPSVERRGGEQMPKSREIPVENRGTKSQGRVGQSVLTKVGGWTSPTLLAPRRRPMSQVSLPLSVGTPDLQRALSAPKWPCGQPSVRRGTEPEPAAGLHQRRSGQRKAYAARPDPGASCPGSFAAPWRGTKSGPSCGSQVRLTQALAGRGVTPLH